MPNDWFRFKQFTVRQSGAAMKVGTDGVLLGAWSRLRPGDNVYLDIGAGTGLIALMIAQRVTAMVGVDNLSGGCYLPDPCSLSGDRQGFIDNIPTRKEMECVAGQIASVRIDAVEIDRESAHQASGNAASSPWSEIIHVYHSGIKEFVSAAGSHELMPEFPFEVPDAEHMGNIHGMELASGSSAGFKYDHIVSNPPWFVDSLESPHQGRTKARHASSLPYADLTYCVRRLLRPGGIFSVILPAQGCGNFISLASENGLRLSRRTSVRTLPCSAPKRVLLEFAFDGHGDAPCLEDELTIETGTPGVFTEEYMRLTEEFYLKF